MTYDYWLRGTERKETIEAASNGQPIDERVVKEPQAGKTVEYGEHGGNTAGKIADAVFKAYFEGK